MIYNDDQLRAMHAGGKGNATARRFSPLWSAVLAAGVALRRWGGPITTTKETPS